MSKAAARNHGLYGGQWGSVGPGRGEARSQSLREELQAREWEAESKALQRPAKSAVTGLVRFRIG